MNNVLLVVAIVSMLITIGSVALFIWKIQQDKKYRATQDSVVLNPVIIEAERLKASLGPLMEQVQALHGALVEGQERSEKAQSVYEAKVKLLEEEIKKKTG